MELFIEIKSNSMLFKNTYSIHIYSETLIRIKKILQILTEVFTGAQVKNQVM
jgi:hypothetical protein